MNVSTGLVLNPMPRCVCWSVGLVLWQAPEVPSEGVDRGRKATSLAQHGYTNTAEVGNTYGLEVCAFG